MPSNESPAGLADLAAAAPGLKLLLLFGSRARGDQRRRVRPRARGARAVSPLDRDILAERAMAVERHLVFRAAQDGPADLRALLAALRNRLG